MMQRNFRIEQEVELTGEFGTLDIHNVYELKRCEPAADGRTLRLEFGANEHGLPGRPPEFVLEFEGIAALELTGLPADLGDLVIERVGFKDLDDRDYAWLLEDTKLRGDEQLVFCADAGSVIRVSARTATVTIPNP